MFLQRNDILCGKADIVFAVLLDSACLYGLLLQFAYGCDICLQGNLHQLFLLLVNLQFHI